MRAAIAGVAGIVLMWLTVAVTLAMTLADSRPRLVLALWPAAASARTAVAIILLSGDSPQTHRHEAVALARGALSREPILAAAASTLGTALAFDGNFRHADLAYRYSERLSRRDLQSQLWFIESAVRRGDVAGALAHYDVALRANPAFVGNMLLPVLARASASPAVRGPLITILRRKPSWQLSYLNTMLTISPPTVVMGEQLGGAQLNPADSAQARVFSVGLSKLVQAKQYRIAAKALPSSQLGLSNGSFEKTPALLPFDWWLASDNDLAAYREPSNAGNGSYVLRFASKDRGGVLARQLVALPAGVWELNGLAGGDGRRGGVSISVTCENQDGIPIAAMPLDRTGVGTHRFILTFKAPGHGCDAQWITIRSSAGVTAEGWVDDLDIKSKRVLDQSPP